MNTSSTTSATAAQDAWVRTLLSDDARYLVSPAGDIHGSVIPIGDNWIASVMDGQRVLATASLPSVEDGEAFVDHARQSVH
ncbi:MAG TPA: hypothetical protein VF292_03895 [Rhodanobacteraceae bacterium]